MPLHGDPSILHVSCGEADYALGGATAVVAHTTAAVLQELRTKAKLRGVAISPTSTGSKLQLSVALANNSLEVGCAGKLPNLLAGCMPRFWCRPGKRSGLAAPARGSSVDMCGCVGHLYL